MIAYCPADATATAIISCLIKIPIGLTFFWCWLTQIVLENRPLNGCLSVILAHLHNGTIISHCNLHIFEFAELSLLQWIKFLMMIHMIVPSVYIFMVALCNRADHYIFILFLLLLLLSFFFFSSPNLSSPRLDVYHTLAHGVVLV